MGAFTMTNPLLAIAPEVPSVRDLSPPKGDLIRRWARSHRQAWEQLAWEARRAELLRQHAALVGVGRPAGRTAAAPRYSNEQPSVAKEKWR